jgi:hypothetical protein
MTHKVLVLCQKKTGKTTEDMDVRPIIDKINNFVIELLGNDAEIKYLTDLKESKGIGTADFIGVFGNNNWTEQTLIKQSYKLIICNTCPRMHMDYNIINEYLQDDGMLALTSFNIFKNKNINLTKDVVAMEKINKLFYQDTTKSTNDALIFKKIQTEYSGDKLNDGLERKTVLADAAETYTIKVTKNTDGKSWVVIDITENKAGGRVKTHKNNHITTQKRLMPNKRIFKNRTRSR